METTWETVEHWHDIIWQTRDVEVSRLSAGVATLRNVLPKDIAIRIARLVRSHGLQWKDYTRQRKIYFDLRQIELQYHAIHMARFRLHGYLLPIACRECG